jgi:hypothetical protein
MKNFNIIPILFLMVLGCENEDQAQENTSPPSSVTLSLSNNVLTWTMNDDDDFFKYSLIGSIKTNHLNLVRPTCGIHYYMKHKRN